ncbi:glycerophosphoryl diester phosphodiesterase [Pseudobutyrivibrio sp. ACV-2]|uniref:glycerophosphodiester phosphodiesterase family protein n=1 Tax=Pseudobutyrivibrio sp. ACV-2 TaxID=1520801 RepID=UPI00089775E7|nr:glycerophosphodiester phosphodiesterase family protein [Pseudobutyrivibrio sp. ACV-2]SEB05279.1 glycerophosphoryl diester phosphodiesterase [Pseudobutyrivibrio sp. ACV-2]
MTKKAENRKNRCFGLDIGLEIWAFRFITSIILFIPVEILESLLNWVSSGEFGAITTANLLAAGILRIVVVGFLAFLISLCYIAIELFAYIGLCDDILNNRKTGIFQEIGRGLNALVYLGSPFGMLLLLYVVIIVPIIGIGFSVSLTENIYIPTFISSVIKAKPIFAVVYYGLGVVLFLITVIGVFTLHGIMLDQKTPKDAAMASAKIVKANLQDFLIRMTKILLRILCVVIVFLMVTNIIPTELLSVKGVDLPVGYHVDLANFLGDNATELDGKVVLYRVACATWLLLGRYTFFVVEIFTSSYLLLKLTQMYYTYTGKELQTVAPRKSKRGHHRYIIRFSLIYVFFAVCSVLLGVFFEEITDYRDTSITAHRTGGLLASENSLDGIIKAAEYGCAGSETDIQRTKDGEYIINHDTTFMRLCGVDKKPSEMTLSEIKKLRSKDTTGSGEMLEVPTLEKLLDTGKGKIKLFLELKGQTADYQMVDDVVAMVKSKDMVDDVVLISLNYAAINYAEETYPEFETGILIFGGVGDLRKLNCDMIIMEEEMTNTTTVNLIHEADKTVGVWTVNTWEAMYHFLELDVDTVITDDIKMAFEVKEELANRSDVIKMRDLVEGMFD